MKKERLQTPQKIKDKILVEFKHRCVCCNAPYHEVHHIDGNPSNNSKDNLIVLCPNCHQGRVHGNSIKITPEQLRLYKKIKSKAVFKPIYNAIKSRVKFIETDEYESLTHDELLAKSEDLIKFIRTLNQGEYYGQELKQLLSRVPMIWVIPDPDLDYKWKEIEKEWRKKIKDNKEKILELVLECIEIQPG